MNFTFEICVGTLHDMYVCVKNERNKKKERGRPMCVCIVVYVGL